MTSQMHYPLILFLNMLHRLVILDRKSLQPYFPAAILHLAHRFYSKFCLSKQQENVYISWNPIIILNFITCFW